MLKKSKYINNINQDSYLKRILKIAFPVAITSIIRSGLSTLKHSLVPIQLRKYSGSSSFALSQYGLINRNDYANFNVPECFHKFICSDF